MKPTVILVGADKGGVGKTTVSRLLLDYLTAEGILLRAFDTETPRGSLNRFYPKSAEVIDITQTRDQIRIIDTLNSSQIKVSVIDTRAGQMLNTLAALEKMGFLEAVKAGEYNLIIMHIIGSSIPSLTEISEIAPYVVDAKYYLVKNYVNETDFFEWDPVTHKKYLQAVRMTGQITVPKLDAMAYEQVEVAGIPFSNFVANRTANGEAANHSFVLRGYVRTWQNKVNDEFLRENILEAIRS